MFERLCFQGERFTLPSRDNARQKIPANAFLCPMKYRYAHLCDGFAYFALEPFIHLAFRAFFRQVHLHNHRAVEANKPVIVASNHPTAFVDPLLMCEYLEPPIYNMTRGDIFQKPFFRKLMESSNMFPVFRRRDGYTGRDRNEEVFDWCVEKLRRGQALVIYVEGEHHLEKRVRPIQKGIARIAFGAYTQHRQHELQIVPAGCNYQYGDRPREEAMLNMGAPIFVRDYWEDYQKNPAATINRLCADIERALKTVCFHLDSTEDDALGEQLLTLHRNDLPQPLLPVVNFESQRFAREKAVLDTLNVLPAPEKAALRERADHYFSTLQKEGLKDEALVKPGRGHWTWLFFLFAGLLPAMAGWLSSWPIRALTYWVADTKVKKREFYGSVVLGVSFLSGLFYYLVWLLVGAIGWGWQGAFCALSLPVLGWFSILYLEVWERWRAARQAWKHSERAVLLQMRATVRG